jgi:hypothetical protein
LEDRRSVGASSCNWRRKGSKGPILDVYDGYDDDDDVYDDYYDKRYNVLLRESRNHRSQ